MLMIMGIGKKQKAIIVTIISVAICVATVPVAIWVTHTQSAELGNGRARCERKPGVVHKVTIQNDIVSPVHTDARECDTLTITNLDSRQRLLAFGQHDNHISYDGISEKLVDQNQNLTVTLIRTGTYSFHDHENDAVNGEFVVSLN
jgi:hypothetical protein